MARSRPERSKSGSSKPPRRPPRRTRPEAVEPPQRSPFSPPRAPQGAPPPHRPVRDRSEIESAINGLPTIQGSAVVFTGQEIREIHVVASSELPPNTLVRKIQAVAQWATGYPFDYRRISLVRVRPRRPLSHGPRPRLSAVSPEGGRVTVSLTEGDSVWAGAAPASDPPTAQEAALATAAAATPLLGPDSEPRLHTLAGLEIGGRAVHLAAIELVRPEGEAMLLGAALIGDDPLLSAARAVLDALNRHLTLPA